MSVPEWAGTYWLPQYWYQLQVPGYWYKIFIVCSQEFQNCDFKNVPQQQLLAGQHV